MLLVSVLFHTYRARSKQQKASPSLPRHSLEERWVGGELMPAGGSLRQWGLEVVDNTKFINGVSEGSS